MSHIVSESWDKVLQSQFSQSYIFGIQTVLKRDAAVLCPPAKDIWNAFKLTDFEKVRVVILGMDPYYSPGSANGLAFSSNKITPSLEVIFKELKLEFNAVRTNPDLTDWAEQGVLMINACLTTVQGRSNAHKNIGWEKLTGHVLGMLARTTGPKVFMLWGRDAKDVGDKYIVPKMTSGQHLILKAIHPQAENYGDGTYTFTGCNHFRRANEFLGERKKGRIKWI